MLSTIFFPELLDAFYEAYPNTAVILEEYGSVRACNLVQNDSLDLALVNMEQYNIDKFHKEILANDQIVFCVDKNHPLAHKTVIATDEMVKQRLIFFNSDSVQNELLKRRFEAEGLTPKIFMRGSQIYTTLQFLKEHKNSCFLYSCMLDKFPSIVGIPLSPPINVAIGMIWKKGKYLSTDTQNFITFTKKYYKENSLVK